MSRTTQIGFLLLLLFCAKSHGFLTISRRRHGQPPQQRLIQSQECVTRPFGLVVPFHTARRCQRLYRRSPKRNSKHASHVAKSTVSPSSVESVADVQLENRGRQFHSTTNSTVVDSDGGMDVAAIKSALPLNTTVHATILDSVNLPAPESSGRTAPVAARSRPEMPWSATQINALCEKVSRYTVQAPAKRETEHEKSGSTADKDIDDSDRFQFLILWRNLVHDTPELAGYPISFLMQKLGELSIERQILLHVDHSSQETATTLLPYLDEYEFDATGGMTANVFGVPGIADGTRIRTNPVANVHVTLPHNFVQTVDQSVTYELGRPLLQATSMKTSLSEQTRVQDDDNADYSLSGLSKRWQRDGKEVAAAMLATKTDTRMLKSSSTSASGSNGETLIDSDLLQLGGLTALVIGGAMAMESLSHHLTVNVFWV